MMADVLESLIRFAQMKLAEESKAADDKTMAISCTGLFREWKPGVFEEGDIRTDGGKPYECRQDHDSITNPTWTIKDRTLWKPYHSRSKEWALPWEQPTGAHDMYKAGEYMVWKDGMVKKCLEDTNFSPDEYPRAWENAA